MDLLVDYEDVKVDTGNIDDRKKKIKETLKSFDIDVDIADVKSGPSVTQYQLKAESGVKVSKIANLQNDLAMALASPTGSVRIEAPIPGKALIGIEVPNNTRAMVSFKSLLMSDSMKEIKSKLAIVLGKDVAGKAYGYDIGKMPHMLVAGTTGSGKSIFIHNVLFSILFRANPNEVKFILIDPKRVELIHYQDIPHLMTPVVTDMSKVPSVFAWAVAEMERRYILFEKARVRNIEGYNKESGFQALPYIIIAVEELGELMQIDPNGVEKSIIRLAQLARATGIHLILTVQRPDTKVITGLIKANIPTRVAFNVMSQIDSRVIIDQPGAEKLLGKGDMLFIPPDMSRPIRLQGAFVSEKEVTHLVEYLKSQGVAPDYRDEIFQAQTKAQNANTGYGNDVDELFDQAVEIVSMAGKASASLLQRKLSIGYARAARIIDELEQNNIIGPADGQKPRDVLLNGAGPKSHHDQFRDMHEVDEPHSEVDSIQD
jgi:S-DNA-T family DNA segregation ATPase FtsK/SpoIIIE